VGFFAFLAGMASPSEARIAMVRPDYRRTSGLVASSFFAFFKPFFDFLGAM
jgi:hypothetical protein